jgi:TorA maturation chaperone TorD
MATGVLADIAQRRSSTYWLLSRLVVDHPSASFLDELGSVFDSSPPDLDLPLGRETLALADAIGGAQSDPRSDELLRVEHTRLLGGLAKRYGAPPPYESVFLEDKLPGEATIAVCAAYAEAGYDSPVPDAGPADYLGSELRFLALLCHRESEAWRAGKHADALAWVERQRAFLDQHALRWMPQHCERAAALAETDYHRAMFTLIARACVIDREDVAELTIHGTVLAHGA